MPNGALASLAGNVDPHHQVAVTDLVLAQARVRTTIEELMKTIEPDLVGLSIMTFQRKTAKKIIDLLHSLRANLRIVVGGYDPSMAPEAYTDSDVDFIVRGEVKSSREYLGFVLPRGHHTRTAHGVLKGDTGRSARVSQYTMPGQTRHRRDFPLYL
jgi:hypothetical protein